MLDRITIGDARQLSSQVEDESISLILTDPVYENLWDYEWLGETAMRVLRPNSACLVWCKTTMHDDCKQVLAASGLTYYYTLFHACSAKTSKPVNGGIFPWVTPCLLFSKGKIKADPHINDWYFSPYTAAQAFEWNKGGPVEKWLGSFSKPGDVVFDPFTGHGTVPVACKRLQRHFIAFEIVPQRAREAQKTLASTPLPLLFENSMTQSSLPSSMLPEVIHVHPLRQRPATATASKRPYRRRRD